MNKEKIVEWVVAHKAIVVGVWLMLVAVGVGLLVWQGGVFEQPQVQIKRVEEATVSGVIKKIVVDMSGEVAKPGVYSFDTGARVVEAITAAGGFSKNADMEWVDKNLNKAAKLSDGEKIYVPRAGEPESVRVEVDNKKINLNNASQATLESLPGVGPVTATKIVAGRPYQDSNELVTKKIVGQKVFDQIKDLVSIW